MDECGDNSDEVNCGMYCLCDPRIGKWAWLTVLLRILQQTHKVTVEFYRSHRVTDVFSGRVTRSQPNFRRSQTVTPVAAVIIVHIGVTTPCDPCYQEYYYIHDTEARVSHYFCKVIVQRLCM